MTGVQRVAHALSSRLSISHSFAAPKKTVGSVQGHLWEQAVLPFCTHGELLWSPCITGPIAVRRQVVTVHDAAVFEHPEWFSRQFAILYRSVVPRLCRRVLKVVTVSSFSRTRLSELLSIDPKRIEVVMNASDASFNPRPASEIVEVKRRYGLDEFDYFITLSTLEPRKNLSLVLKAWEVVRSKLNPRTRLVVVGKAGSESVFGKSDFAAERAEDIIYTGYLPEEDLPALLSGSLALIYPSLYEGFGLPLIEGMSCGTPVVTTRLTSLPEVGQNAAIYVDENDPSDLARCLLTLATSQEYREEHSGRGLERAAQFSWDSSAAQMDRILSALA